MRTGWMGIVGRATVGGARHDTFVKASVRGRLVQVCLRHDIGYGLYLRATERTGVSERNVSQDVRRWQQSAGN